MKKIDKEKVVSTLKNNRKKIIVLSILVLLLAGTACLNYFLSEKRAGQTSTVELQEEEMTFFETYRADRTSTRAQEILYLDDVIASEESDEETKNSAQNKKVNLVDNMETELCLEGLIKAKGFGDCVVTISNDCVNVVVQIGELTDVESAQILSVVTEQTDYLPANVIIIPYI